MLTPQGVIELGGDIDNIVLPNDRSKSIKLSVTITNTQENRILAAQIDGGAVKLNGYKAEAQDDIEDGTVSEQDPDQGELDGVGEEEIDGVVSDVDHEEAEDE